MVTRIVAAPRPGDAFEGQRGYPYWNPHADKLNNGGYEVSCLLYLNTRGVGFAGGDFAFLDVDADRLVAPRAGRLLAFTGGTDNFHQVRRVEAGARFALALWFRRVGTVMGLPVFDAPAAAAARNAASSARSASEDAPLWGFRFFHRPPYA